MSSGLAWLEDYVDAGRSDVIEMLFGSGKDDVAAFAARSELAHPPDTVWCYSSGTSNLVSAIAGRALGGGRESVEAYLRRELFERIGMRSASLRFDASGTWIGSSFVFATARDYARFGLLALRDGVWEGERVLPEGCRVVVRRAAWRVPAVFETLREAGHVSEPEMLRTFNLGIGYVVIVREASADAVRSALEAAGETVWAIGEVVAGPAGVEVA